MHGWAFSFDFSLKLKSLRVEFWVSKSACFFYPAYWGFFYFFVIVVVHKFIIHWGWTLSLSLFSTHAHIFCVLVFDIDFNIDSLHKLDAVPQFRTSGVPFFYGISVRHSNDNIYPFHMCLHGKNIFFCFVFCNFTEFLQFYCIFTI